MYWILKFFRDVKNITLEGTLSQIFPPESIEIDHIDVSTYQRL